MDPITRKLGFRWQYLALALLAPLVLTLPADAGERGTCLVAELDEPFRLPDGSSHPAGAIRICLERFSPVADLHTISTPDGDRGFYLGRRTESEQDAQRARPEFVFERRGGGSLRLVAYRLPGADRIEVYWLESPKRARRPASKANRIPRGNLEFIAAATAR